MKKPDFHVLEYTVEEIEKMLKDSNFVRIETVGLGAWLPNFVVKKFPELSDYLGKIRLNYTFSCIATKPKSHSDL